MFDSVLLWTIVFILCVAIVDAVVRSRRRDVCLKSFTGYLVYIRMKNGKQVWGELHTDSTGIELRYRANHLDAGDGHVESSYIFFKNEFANFYLLIRFLDELTPRNAARRARTLKRSYRPGPVRRLRRRIRNGFNILRDAIGQAFTTVVAATSKTASPAIAAQQKSLTQVSTEAVEWFGNAYDPILERHIGRRVVIEIHAPDGQRHEYVGVFREYSADYLEIMDVSFGDGDSTRQVDLIVPRAHGVMRHDGEPVPAGEVPANEPAPALLATPTEPETNVRL